MLPGDSVEARTKATPPRDTGTGAPSELQDLLDEWLVSYSAGDLAAINSYGVKIKHRRYDRKVRQGTCPTCQDLRGSYAAAMIKARHGGDQKRGATVRTTGSDAEGTKAA